MFAIVGLSAQTGFAGPAQFVIVNINAPNVGFNDPTPRAPVGGNNGTTLGQQRLIAFQRAAEICPHVSTATSRFELRSVVALEQVCSAVLPVTVVRNFAGAPLANTWYHVAPNKLANTDLVTAQDDITASFSSTFNFYLGLDNNHGNQPIS